MPVRFFARRDVVSRPVNRSLTVAALLRRAALRYTGYNVGTYATMTRAGDKEVALSSKGIFQRELQNARITRALNDAKCGRMQIGNRSVEVHVIQHIEKFKPKLESLAFT